MNKYQEYFLKKWGSSLISIIYRAYPMNHNEMESKSTYVSCDDDNTTLIIHQDCDITLTKYTLMIRDYDRLSGISVNKNGNWSEADYDPQSKIFQVTVDFDDRIDQIRLSFVNNLADDLLLNVQYQEADKEAYYAKIEADKRKNMIEKARIKVAEGQNLVNIYFQPCCDEYAYSEILLYINDNMLAKFKVEEAFFKAIPDLAYGYYSFTLKQYDGNGALLFESDRISFCIERPNYGRKPTIVL